MRKQFFDMYLLLLFARLYYSKSHTLPKRRTWALILLL